ncbi:lysylphosphatidylglycerol synthetase-like protein (DUF2156 family) [Conyzicola lurida]|uniref:Lysylphosphatidylglycerol synthetase-like protein (DUF2156 family) n=1 Tax=Conyzicola lurida TaxID=1172621 RepID=A0A841AMX3_9MICO|nr:hypothetical protein [Conyzicola lurida]MBB5843101.1 lysylphosphatidylglycerol synthetase-like protein (DUF2156 family) [Conyzicola lurida]
MAQHAAPPLPEEPPGQPEVPLAVRAQLLATEHWGLLASRSTAQSEVLTRISVFLTLVSASLLSLALVGQATDFSEQFSVFAILVLAVAVLVGVLTQIRVFSVGMEDLMYVLAMNRLRGAYVEIDPAIARYFLASPHDDRAGSVRTYYFFGGRSDFSQVAGSSMVFITAVESVLLGLLVSTVAGVASAPSSLSVVLGVVGGIGCFAVSMWLGQRTYTSAWKKYRSEFPTPPVDER